MTSYNKLRDKLELNMISGANNSNFLGVLNSFLLYRDG